MRILTFLLGCCFFATSTFADVESLRNQAAEAIADGNNEQAISLLGQALIEAPGHGPVNYQLGVLLMNNNGNLDTALDHFKRAAEAGFQQLGVTYHLARIHGRKGDTEQTLKALEELAAGGFGMINLVEGHKDFAFVASEERYTSALEQMRKARFPCTEDPKHRAFDFWLGDWRVSLNGNYAGSNSITSILGGCALFEQWTSANGGEGKSFNYYDPAHDHWRQIWIGDSGTFIEFTGEARDGGIYYTAETINPDKSVTHHRFEFTQNEDGSVRQFWQTSPDRETWTTIWDGRYDRVDVEVASD